MENIKNYMSQNEVNSSLTGNRTCPPPQKEKKRREIRQQIGLCDLIVKITEPAVHDHKVLILF